MAVRAAIADALGLGHPPHAGCIAIDSDALDRAALAAIRADRAWRATVEHAARYE
jgi:hypothetical protein